MLAVTALFLLLLAVGLRAGRREPLRVRLRAAFTGVRLWPLALLLCGTVGLASYIATAPNPIFRTGDNLPHHMRWHALWIGLSYDPDWPLYFPDLPAGRDATAQIMTLRLWLASGHSAEEFNSPYTKAMNIGLHERLVRTEYLKFIRAHPIYLLKSVFYYKPISFYQTVKGLYSSADFSIVTPFVAVLWASIFLCLLGTEYRFRPLVATLIVAIQFICSLSMVMLAYPTVHALADQVWMTTVLVTAIVAATLSTAIRPALRIMRTAAEGASDWFVVTSFAAGVVTLILIGMLIKRATLPAVNFLDAKYDLCASETSEAQRASISKAQIYFMRVGSPDCDGRLRCAFHAERSDWLQGETVESCKRELQMSWQCGRSGRVNDTRVQVDIDDGYKTQLACR